LAKDFHPIDLGHPNIQQKEVRGFIGAPTRAMAKKKIQNGLAVVKVFNAVVQPGALQVFLNQPHMPEVIIGNQYNYFFGHAHLFTP
jgi:hypothetical protein